MLLAKISVLKVLLLATALLDATTSAGHKELNPMMKPFSHGGLPTMVVGEALYTTLALKLTQPAQENKVMTVNVAAHAVGIAFTLSH